MAYQPLKQSALWENYQDTIARHPGNYGTGLGYFMRKFTAYFRWADWQDGVLVDLNIPTAEYEKMNFDEPYIKNPEDLSVQDITNHPLTALIPVVPFEKYLNSPDGNHPDARADNEMQIKKSRTDTFSENCAALYLPINADVHHIAMAMMLAQNVLTHPVPYFGWNEDFNQTDKEQEIAKWVIATGLQIIEARGIEEDFAKSCAEITSTIDELTEISDNVKNRYYEHLWMDQEVRDSIAKMSPAERQDLAKKLKTLFD